MVHVYALNLSVQGRQTYELVGSNMYVIGEVYVDVYGDTLTVTYHNYYDGKGGNTNHARIPQHIAAITMLAAKRCACKILYKPAYKVLFRRAV